MSRHPSRAGLALPLLAAGCFGHVPEPPNETYDQRAGEVEYRVEQGTEGVIRIALRMHASAAASDLPTLEARCRRAAVSLGEAEAARRRMPPPYRIPDEFLLSRTRYDPTTGIARCEAEAPVFPSDGRPWGR